MKVPQSHALVSLVALGMLLLMLVNLPVTDSYGSTEPENLAAAAIPAAASSIVTPSGSPPTNQAWGFECSQGFQSEFALSGSAGDMYVLMLAPVGGTWSTTDVGWSDQDSGSTTQTLLVQLPNDATYGYALYTGTIGASSFEPESDGVATCLFAALYPAGYSVLNWAAPWMTSGNVTENFGGSLAISSIADDDMYAMTIFQANIASPTFTPNTFLQDLPPATTSGAFGTYSATGADSSGATLTNPQAWAYDAGSAVAMETAAFDIGSAPPSLTCSPYNFQQYPVVSRPYERFINPAWENVSGGTGPYTFSWTTVLNGSSATFIASAAHIVYTAVEANPSDEALIQVNFTGNYTFVVNVTDADDAHCTEWAATYDVSLSLSPNPLVLTPPAELVFGLEGSGVVGATNISFSGNVTIQPYVLSVAFGPSATCSDFQSGSPNVDQLAGYRFADKNYSVNATLCATGVKYVPMENVTLTDLAVGNYTVRGWINDTFWNGWVSSNGNVSVNYTFSIRESKTSSSGSGGGGGVSSSTLTLWEEYAAIFVVIVIAVGIVYGAYRPTYRNRRRRLQR